MSPARRDIPAIPAIPDARARATRVTGVIGRPALVACAVGLLVSACSADLGQVIFNGSEYPTKVESARGDPSKFTVTVRRADRGTEGAQKAASQTAVNYCIEQLGTSRIEWAPGADGQAGPVYNRSGDRLKVTGRCAIWD